MKRKSIMTFLTVGTVLALTGCESPKMPDFGSLFSKEPAPVSEEISTDAAAAPVTAEAAEERPAASAAIPETTLSKTGAVAKKNTAQVPASASAQDQKVYQQLEAFAASYLDKCNKHGAATKAKPSVVKNGNVYVATYVEVDTSNYTLQLIPSQQKTFSYIAKLSYSEKTFVSEGKTMNEALKGPYKLTRLRKLTELPRYMKGKWVN